MLDRITPLLVSAALAMTLVGCVDNSGGEPPAGEALEFAVALDDTALLCRFMGEDGRLLVSEQDVDDFVAACGDADGSIEAVADSLDSAVAGLTEGQALLLVSVELGGCLGPWDLGAVHLDGEVLRPWLLKADSSFGKPETACTADLGQGQGVFLVEGAAEATSVELTVGIYNPELPGGPELPVDEIEG